MKQTKRNDNEKNGDDEECFFFFSSSSLFARERGCGGTARKRSAGPVAAATRSLIFFV